MTEKSGKMAPVETELHVPEVIHKTQHVLNGHVSEWIKLTGIGGIWNGNVKTQRETNIEDEDEDATDEVSEIDEDELMYDEEGDEENLFHSIE